jgi:hypothetical protein
MQEIQQQLMPILQGEFLVSEEVAEDMYRSDLEPHLLQLRPTIYFLIEYPYVDRIYRDSYYHYFSTKLGNYKKDCIRLSIFEGEIFPQDFRENEKIKQVAERYLGFMVLRPTVPAILGRNIISPHALRVKDFLSVGSSFQTTVNAIKFQANGFPHSSQDRETITCAETALWAIMEYFASKYSDYKPALPSTIVDALKYMSVERQVPSKGLFVNQLAFAIKKFGFGSRIYAREEYGDNIFKSMISTYVESGLPLICALDNTNSGGTIAHAILAIGHQVTSDHLIDTLVPTDEKDDYLANMLKSKNIKLYDNDDIKRAFVFMDDNCPAYQLASLDAPTLHYPDFEWQTCELTHFIVPLYPKIYLEAYEAKSYAKDLLLNDLYFDLPKDTEYFIRLLLTSSRSYKDVIARDMTFPDSLKCEILETAMPKFIWVAEISNKELVKKRQAQGLLLLDATEPNLQGFNALILMAHQNLYLYPDNDTKELIENNLPLKTFSMYLNNLNGF